MSSRTIMGAVWALSVVAIAFLGCRACSDHSEEVLPNIILITLDTVRADHLSCYGYSRETSPFIDAFAGTATRYTRAISSSSWTVPAHASLFTGKNPFEHGAHTFRATEPMNNVNPLDESHLTLAEVLGEEGYETGAFVANAAFLGKRWRLDQGFDTYWVKRLHAPLLNHRVAHWLSNREGRPFFLFVNYMDAHRPYNTTRHAPFLAQPAVQDKGQLVQQLYQEVMPGTHPFPQELAQKVIDQYDTAITILDEEIEALFAEVRRLDLYDDTLIVLTSDHGEFFGEHQLVEHSKDVYEEVLRVPLIVKSPHQTEGRIVDQLTTSTDLPGLVLSQLSTDLASKYLESFPDAPGNHEVIAENYYARRKDFFNPEWGGRFDRVRTAFYEWPYKLIHSTDSRHELYQLERDVSESTDLIEAEPRLAERLKKKLVDFQNSRERSDKLIDQPPLTEEEIRMLKELGYIGQ